MADSPFRRNWKIIVALGAAVLIIAILLITSGNRGNGDQSSLDITQEELGPGEVRVTGTVTCLELTGATPEDCIKALRGDDGKIYALDTTEGGAGITTYDEGAHLVVVGIYTPRASSEESNVFQYDGVLKVREFVQQ